MSTPTAPPETADPVTREDSGPPAEDSSAREVLVGVDGSESALGAVRWAAQEAVRREAPLKILHAAPYLVHRGAAAEPPPELARARRITAQAYTAAVHTEHGLRASTDIVPGDPTTTLLRAAAAAQLLVLGSSTTGAVDEWVVAPVGRKVAAHAPTPVVVVPRRRGQEPADRPVVAVLGIEDREDDEAVASFAALAAARFGVGLSVLQTRSPRRTVRESWVDDPAEWSGRHPDLEVQHDALPDAHGDRLLAATCPSPLLVMSAGHGSLLHRTLDAPHRWLLRHCTSPMALVPPANRRDTEPREETIAVG